MQTGGPSLTAKPSAQRELARKCFDAGDHQGAVELLEKALAQKPDFADAHFDLGIVLERLGKPDDAIECFELAADLRPELPRFQRHLARALAERGDVARALGHLHAALASDPNSVDATVELAATLVRAGRFDMARATAERALGLEARSAAAHHALGNAWRGQGQLDQAIQSHRRALELEPAFSAAYADLAAALLEVGQVGEAIQTYREALRIDPENHRAHSALVFCMGFLPSASARAILDEARSWARRHAEPLAVRARPLTNQPEPERRLRVGYVSSTFWRHVLSHFTAPLFEHHDPDEVEVYCYAGDVRPEADDTYRFREPRIVWRDGVPRDDVALAELVRSDGIDILVDLNLHMAEGRVRAFACRPAPVQITWLGYPGTTGLSAVDFRITDPHIDPPELLSSGPYVERSLALPDTFWCYEPRASGLSVSTLPALENGAVTFGCLNGLWKVNPGVVELWAKVLSATPGSRLVLVGPGSRAGADVPGTSSAERRVLELFRELGISGERVEFVPRASRREYLSYYQRIDIGLDTLPYAGHTTSLDAFFMGVPVVTLIGDTVVGRAGLCFAENLGLPGLVARSPGEFVEAAQKLTADLDALAELRAELRPRLQASPLMDAPRFARNLEAIYRRVWREWCAAATSSRS